MKRVLLILLFPLLACAQVTGDPALAHKPPKIKTVTVFQYDFAVAMDLTVAEVLHDVQQYFPREAVFCVGGAIVDHLFTISWAKIAPNQERAETRAKYNECVDPTFLGVAHNHPNRTDCTFSGTDIQTFNGSGRAMIDVVVGASCIRIRRRDGQELVFAKGGQ